MRHLINVKKPHPLCFVLEIPNFFRFFLTQRQRVSQSFLLLILQNAVKIILCAKLCALCVSV